MIFTHNRYHRYLSYGITAALLLLLAACKKETVATTTPYPIPNIPNFRKMPVDPENPMTVEGVALGKRLFFDPILSRDSTISCASCHLPSKSFSDTKALSKGIDNIEGKRNAMPLVNLAWFKNTYFWDGRSKTLREQALFPVEAPDEMHLPWPQAELRIQRHPVYKTLFEKAFGTGTPTRTEITKAIEQFENTLLSYNAPFDRYLRGEIQLDSSVLRGLEIFRSEKGDCFHCHTTASPELFIDPLKTFANNGMDVAATVFDFPDPGLGAITGNNNDRGRFKIPTMRNLGFTAPYMHDGRFATLDEVIDMYNLGPKNSPNVEPIMIEKANIRFQNTGSYGLGLTTQEKADLKAFLLSLTDSTFIQP